MGLLQTLPLAVTLTVEKGFAQAVSEIGYMIMSGGPLYFIFHIQTKCYYFQQTLMAGGAMYRPTGRGFVIRHSPFDENYRFFASSHIYLGFELMVALILFALYTKSTQYFGLTWSLWLTVVSFLLGPFWFNPLSFEWNKLKDDYHQWMSWMMEIGGTSEQSWEAWWKEENNFYFNLAVSWKLYLFVQKCALWMFIANGLFGQKMFRDEAEQYRMVEILTLFGIFFFGNWIINKMEKYFTYAVRRFTSLLLSTIVGVVTVYLFFVHTQYIRYTIAVYYFIAAIAFLFLILGGQHFVLYVYKLHDYIVGHAIFMLLSILALLQVFYFFLYAFIVNTKTKFETKIKINK
jgi:callose synthase